MATEITTTRTHTTSLGRYAPDAATVDLDGYIALPGARIEDHRYDGVDLDSDDADYWREDWWPGILAANARAVAVAEAELAEWQDRDA